MKYIKYFFLPITIIFLIFMLTTKSKVISFLLTLSLILTGAYFINDSYKIIEIDTSKIESLFISNNEKPQEEKYVDLTDAEISDYLNEVKTHQEKQSCEDLNGERVFSHKGTKEVTNPETGVIEEVEIDKYNCLIPNLN